MTGGQPAILGGTPAFEEPLPMVRPELPSYDSELGDSVRELLETGMLTKGRHLRKLEERLAEHLQVDHVVAVSSCTLGLLLTYRAVGLTGEVIVPSFTFMATVHPLVWTGAQPVFVDVHQDTWNLDPDAVEDAITDRTTGIVAVHQFGNPAAIDTLQAIADRHDLPLVFDAAHGMGSLYGGRPIGSFGSAEIFSLSPTKLLVAGEGGIVSTNDGEIAEQVRLGREYGNAGNYRSVLPGLSARMPEFNALLALRGLDRLEEYTEKRNKVAHLYLTGLSSLPGLATQGVDREHRSSYKDFGIVVDEEQFGLSRDRLAEAVRAEGIDTRAYYDPPVHTHDPYTGNGSSPDLPVTHHLARCILNLPIWSAFPDGAAERVCEAIERIHTHRAEVRA